MIRQNWPEERKVNLILIGCFLKGDLEDVYKLDFNDTLSISVLFVPGISVKMCQSERWCNSTKKMLFAC